MSELADTARVSLILADFANQDASGKLNLVGAGVSITGIDQQTGQTAPFCLVLSSGVDPRFIGSEYALEVALYADDGNIVVLPQVGEASPMRIAQTVQVTAPQPPAGAYIPTGTVWPGTQMIVNFQNGLPLTVGRGYEWRASIDGTVRAAASLLVAGPPPMVFG